MKHVAPRMFVMACRGTITLGQPLPLRATALGTQVIPLAEVLPETYEAHRQYFTMKSFAVLAGISVSTVKREIAAGRLKAKKLGRRTVIAHEDAMAYLASLPAVGSQLTLDDIADGPDRK